MTANDRIRAGSTQSPGVVRVQIWERVPFMFSRNYGRLVVIQYTFKIRFPFMFFRNFGLLEIGR